MIFVSKTSSVCFVAKLREPRDKFLNYSLLFHHVENIRVLHDKLFVVRKKHRAVDGCGYSVDCVSFERVENFAKQVVGGDSGKMATSTDGTTWTAVADSTFGTDRVQDIVYGNNMFVAVGGRIATSADGTTWTDVSNSPFSQNFSAVAYGNGTFVIGASEGRIAYCRPGN